VGLQVRVEGGAQLAAVRRRLAAVGEKGLARQMAKSLRAAAAPLRPAIRAEAVVAMPSGYGPTLSRSLRFRQSTRAGGSVAEVAVRVYGDGRKERRHVPALNRGRLRHPLFGRRGWWYEQRVRPGFVDRPADRLAPDAARQMRAVIDYVAEQIGA
jgi:hypothetical protein